MAKETKRQKKIKELVESEKEYQLGEALELVTNKLPKSKFDETLEVAIRLGVDPRKADENVRSTVSLPNGTGKVVKVLAICKGDKAKEAQEAGADFVGAEDMVAKIQEGWLDFDSVVVTPDMMAQVGKVGKLLGPRGLMPNPKTGTVTQNIGQAVSAIKGGRVEFRVDKSSIVHVPVGKVSFGGQKLQENFDALIDAIKKVKPKASKGVYLQKVSIATTHGPGLNLEISSIR